MLPWTTLGGGVYSALSVVVVLELGNAARRLAWAVRSPSVGDGSELLGTLTEWEIAKLFARGAVLPGDRRDQEQQRAHGAQRRVGRPESWVSRPGSRWWCGRCAPAWWTAVRPSFSIWEHPVPGKTVKSKIPAGSPASCSCHGLPLLSPGESRTSVNVMPLPYQQGLTDSIPYRIVALCCYGRLASGQVEREAGYTATANLMPTSGSKTTRGPIRPWAAGPRPRCSTRPGMPRGDRSKVTEGPPERVLVSLA